ncbi:MAG: AEC family transporter [Clostridia bacterium]|nr:AEC family transporter [Clostridia bacterium]
MEQFIIALVQIGIFLILICIGIITMKIKIFDAHSLAAVSRLVMQISLPSYIFINAVNSATKQSLIDSLMIVPIAIILYIILVIVSAMIEKAFRLQGNRKNVFRASLIFGNIGFMGIPLVAAIYPDTALLYVSIFTIVDQIFFWTYGVLLTKPVSNDRPKISLANLKNLLSPPLLAIILATIFIITEIHIPAVFSSALAAIGSTSMPLALIYIGGILCTSDIRPVLKCGELYGGIIIKMIILPVACYLVMSAIGITNDMAGTLAFIVALPGIEMVPMLAKESGSDGDYAVCAIMMTTIACLLTLPIVSLCISLFG